MPTVRLERVSFTFRDSEPILSCADLHLPEGWTALVGENGAGKTTLLRLLCGELTPDGGRIRLWPGARVLLCRQTVDRPGEGVDRLAASGSAEGHRLRGLLRLDPAELERWATLSPGERKRWQIGGALHAHPDVLLLDEPTNHVDETARALLAEALAGFDGVGVVVSHDRALLEALTARTARLEGGALELFPLAYGEARAAWEARAAAAWEARGAAQEEERRIERRLADARRARAEADRSRSNRGRDRKDSDARTMAAKNLKGWAEDRLGRQVGILRRASARAAEAVPDAPARKELGRSVFLGYARAPRPVLLAVEAEALAPAPGVEAVLREVKVQLRREDRVWIRGPNGAGKSTLVGALLAGSTLPPGRLLHLPQELSAGAGQALLDELRGLPGEERGRVLSLVAALGSDPARLLASADPSPGEARKLALAMGMGRHAWALVLDEPTNHLDLPTVERLEEALAAFPGAVLLVTHDPAFAARCTTSAWRVGDGRVTTA